jgi:hypothetical protein
MSKTSETQQTNPLREGLATRALPQACTVVIFGATGDLTMRKLIHSLPFTSPRHTLFLSSTLTSLKEH